MTLKLRQPKKCLENTLASLKKLRYALLCYFLPVLCFSHIAGQTFPFLIFLSSILGSPGLGCSKGGVNTNYRAKLH